MKDERSEQHILGQGDTVAVTLVVILVAGLNSFNVLATIYRSCSNEQKRASFKTCRTIDESFNQVMPEIYSPKTNLLQYWIEEVRLIHYYQRNGANQERSSDLRCALMLLSHTLGLMAANLFLVYILYSQLESTWVLQLLIAAALSTIIALPVQVLGDSLASLLENAIQARHMQHLHPRVVQVEGSKQELEQGLELEEFGNESLMLQRKKGTLLRAARCARLRRSLDYCPVAQELQLLLAYLQPRPLAKEQPIVGAQAAPQPMLFLPWAQRPEAFDSTSHCLNYVKYMLKSLKHRVYRPGDPLQAWRLLVHAWQLRPHLLLTRLAHARSTAERMRYSLVHMQSPSGDAAVEALLLRLFFAHWQSGCAHRLLHQLLLEQAPAPLLAALRLQTRRSLHLPRTYLLLFGLLLLYLAALAALAFSARSVPPHAARLWLLSCLLAHLVHASVLLPSQVLLAQLYAPAFARAAFQRLHATCRARWRFVLARERGFLLQPSLLQHFHPVCRLARMLPQYSTCRALLSLRDGDLLAAMQSPSSGAAVHDAIECSAASHSPLVVDCLQLALGDAVARLRLFSRRVAHYLRMLHRGALHLVLLLPRACRNAAWEALAALLCYGLAIACCLSSPAVSTAVLLGAALCLWSLLGCCFAICGPLRWLCGSLLLTYRAGDAYLVREKKTRSRRPTAGAAAARKGLGGDGAL
jgi:hypothetical protein